MDESVQPVPDTSRDEKGRFIAGNSGGGRPIGAKNKLTSIFLQIVATDFDQFGAQALAMLREQDLPTYFRVVSCLISREVVAKIENAPDIDYAELDDDARKQLVEREVRRARVDLYLDQARQIGRKS